jgi:hypothetical protein
LKTCGNELADLGTLLFPGSATQRENFLHKEAVAPRPIKLRAISIGWSLSAETGPGPILVAIDRLLGNIGDIIVD